MPSPEFPDLPTPEERLTDEIVRLRYTVQLWRERTAFVMAERDRLREENEALRNELAAKTPLLRQEARIAELEEALERIKHLRVTWDAPLQYSLYDLRATAAWATVGSQANAIATVALERGSE